MSANVKLLAARDEIKALDKKASLNMAKAINRAAAQTRTQAARNIRAEVKLPAAYVNKHLTVAAKANSNRLQATIRATRRPVLLSRFGARQITKSGKNTGVSVHVSAAGGRKRMPGAFLIRLRGGNGMGIAARVGKGRDAYEIKYGPSVDQVFRNTREDLIDEAQNNVIAEFHRLTRAGI